MPEGKPALLCKAGATDSISLTLTKRVWIMPEDVRKLDRLITVPIYPVKPSDSAIEVKLTMVRK